MNVEKYIPQEFIKTIYRYKPDYNENYPDIEYSFINSNGNQKHPKNTHNNHDRYDVQSTEIIKNVPSKNFKISSTHYTDLDYYSVVDGVMIEDERGFDFKIGNANFIQLARECTIKNGVIEDECIIGFDKHARITLVKVGSSYYNEVMDYTDKQNTIFEEKDLVIGSVYVMKSDMNKQYMYLGKHKFKSKHEYNDFLCGISQPKLLQNVFIQIFTNGNTRDVYKSFKVSSIGSEVKLNHNVSLKKSLKDFKNSKFGRVLTKIEFTEMTDLNKKYYQESKNLEVYVVYKNLDGSMHLGIKKNYSSHISYICPLDKNTMPVLTPEMKENSYCYFYKSLSGFMDKDITYYNCKFYFEDPLSTDIT